MIDACELSPSYIRSIAPYQPGKPTSELAREMGLEETSIVKLASNENPLGLSTLAQRAIEQAIDELARYPDGSGFELKRALCERYNVDAAQLVLGNGSNDVLELVARVFLAPGTSAVFAQHAFAVYPLATQAAGASLVEVPARDFGHDLDAMAAAVREDTRVLWIANPNNPTGTLVRPQAVRSLLERVPPWVMVVLDEAYNEYLPDALRVDTPHWIEQFPNLVVTRTFSKAYGLAGLRVGFAIAHPDVADLMNRVRQPFNVGSLGQAAAIAALSDNAFVAKSRAVNDAGMRQLTEGFKRLKLDYIPSYGNFVSVRVGAGARVYQQLLRAGVIVRPVAAYGMPEFLRVSIGLEHENARLLDALLSALHA
ncbi:MAG TPA: histidinol-phosphate transaminase [Burkholderiales bacterium]|nr:histidinol-phosphate transaminase [Burkholderiales bacterium]